MVLVLPGNVADQHGRRGAREAGDAVVLCEPVARVSQAFDVLCGFDGSLDGRCGRFARPHAYQIQHRNA
jgi:hypothetical protein